MPTTRFPWTARILAAVLCSLALTILLSGPATAGKGSSGVVKATATAAKADATGKQTVTISLAIDPGWHVYANPVNNKDFASVQTVVTFPKIKGADVKFLYPKGKEHKEKDGTSYLVYEDKATIQAVVQRTAGDSGPLDVEVRFNACHGVRGVCLAPGTEKITLP